MENVRYLLYQFNPHTSIYIGNKYALPRVVEVGKGESQQKFKIHEKCSFVRIAQGYMAGGSYILSKKALEKFVTKIMKNDTICRSDGGGSEDLEMGRCLQHHTLAIDGRDMSQKQQRFFPIGVEYPMKSKFNSSFWYERYQWFNVTRGNLNCCSDTLAAMHYIKPWEMNFLEFLIYHLHPYGIEKNFTETLPSKLTLNEVIEAANTKSFSPNYRAHKIIHYIDDDEKFR